MNVRSEVIEINIPQISDVVADVFDANPDGADKLYAGLLQAGVMEPCAAVITFINAGADLQNIIDTCDDDGFNAIPLLSMLIGDLDSAIEQQRDCNEISGTVLAVGCKHPWASYFSNRPDGMLYAYQGGQHECVICVDNPSPQEISAVHNGDIQFGIASFKHCMFLLWRLKDGPWSDQPYSHCLVFSEAGKPVFDLPKDYHLVLPISLVDRASGVIRALNIGTLSPHFSRELHKALEEQIKNPHTPEEHNAAVSHIYEQYPTSKDLLRVAMAVCWIGS